MKPIERSRSDAGTSDTAGQENAEASGKYSSSDEKASADRTGFTRRKFEWLDQVASDPRLPPLACRLAILLVNRYLNSSSAEAWPGVETLARLVGKSVNPVRDALRAMERCDHMKIEWSTGGKSKTNRYTPVLKPSGNLKGMDGANPSDLEGDTLQIPDAKPFRNLKGNPFEGLPLKEPAASVGGPSARQPSADASSSSLDVEGDTRPEGASPYDRAFFPGRKVEHEVLGLITIEEIYPDTRRALVTIVATGEQRTAKVGPDAIFYTTDPALGRQRSSVAPPPPASATPANRRASR